MLSSADRATLAAIYRTFVPAAAPETGIEAMGAAIERLAERKRAELQRFLALLRSPAFSLLLLGKAKTFAALDASQRERLLLTLANHPAAQLRTAYQALKRLSLFIAYSYCEGGTNPLWQGMGYPGPRGDLPGVTTELQLVTPPDLRSSYDVVVVGSGAGGGTAAAVCAKAGMSVLVLESGPPSSQTARAQREFDAFANLYLDAGLTSTDDLGVAILAGSCVGGGTTVNWSTSLQLQQAVAQQWGAAAGGLDFADRLTPHYLAVGERLGLAPTFDHNRNNGVLKRGAEALDWRGYAHPRNATGCGAECGYCGFGCAYNRKNSTARTYLHDAVLAGAHVAAFATVENVHLDSTGRAHGVNVMFVHAGEPMRRTIAAKRVIVAAGALRTPGILSASGVKNRHLGMHLRLHPATAVLAEFPEDVEPWNGPIQSYLIDEFGEIDDAYGFKLEAVPAHPGLAALAAPWNGAQQHEQDLRVLRKCAVMIALVRDRGEGRVGANGSGGISYKVGDYDARHLKLGIEKLAHLALAAGASRVQTLHNSPLTAHNAEDLPAFTRATHRASSRANRLGIFSAHQMGTARIHRDAQSGVVDENGRVHGHANVYVADSSVFPLASGVNPMLTIMALAHAIAGAVVREA
jgi:choline dehydrogenase-like flavoprotein